MAGGKQGPKPKHVPQRTCIACRQVAGKRSFVRIVRGEAGLEIDPTGKKPGRGAYLHPYLRCWQLVLSGGRLEHALRTTLSAQDRQMLLDYMQGLPENEETTMDQDRVER